MRIFEDFLDFWIFEDFYCTIQVLDILMLQIQNFFLITIDFGKYLTILILD